MECSCLTTGECTLVYIQEKHHYPAEFWQWEQNFGTVIESLEKVNNTFLQTADSCITTVVKVNNPFLQTADSCIATVVKVSHGTEKEFVENIIHENFNWCMHGKSNGTVFGQGVYFITDPKCALHYAKSDCNGRRCIIIASIIVCTMIKLSCRTQIPVIWKYIHWHQVWEYKNKLNIPGNLL